MMNAIEITQTGGPEVMQMRDLAIPEPQHGEVLIQVAASGINFVDIFVREGRFGNQTPFTPGQEAAGTVAAVGPGVSDLKQGDRVAWCSVLGTYAEYALAPAERVVPIPDDVTFELAAAAALLQSMTAHYRSRSAYMIQPGDEVLIHAGAGGTGLLLTQMAQSCGARVITGGILGVKPVSNLLTLSVGKAGLRCAAAALFPDFAAQGVHVAVLTIGAGIAPGSKSAEQSDMPSGVCTPSRGISGFGKHSMGDSDLLANLTYIAWEMDKRNLAFLLVREYQAKDSIGAALKQAFGGGPLAELSLKMDVGAINYDSLAAGFLFGKCRSKPQTDGMARGDKVVAYLNDRGLKILSALDTVEADTGARPAEISLAWLMQKKAVTAPIASAKAYPQLESLANYQHDFGPIFSRYFR